jgi:hypothetical protein
MRAAFLAQFRDGEHICFTDRFKRINDGTVENGFLDVNPI